MWEFLPIQTKNNVGRPYTVIQPDFPYPRSPDVRVLFWKDVPAEIQEWALSAWRDHFEFVRNPISPDDLFAWIPGVGTLLAKRSRWMDDCRSFPVVFVLYTYVHPSSRNQQVTPKLVTSLCHEAVQLWNIHVFAFELESIPSGLTRRNAIPFLRFDYVWVPFFVYEEPWREMTHGEMKKYVRTAKGFHPVSYEGWRAYVCPSTQHVVVLDAHNDVVTYDSLRDLLRCHIPGMRGAYMRVFSPIGKASVFLENFYFEPTYSEYRVV